MNKIKKELHGITLVSLVVTIIVLLILSGVAISITVGNNGMFNRAKSASDEHIKQEATEAINLKITGIQIQSYTENETLPSLQYLSDKLCEDDEIEYVTTSKKVASLDKIMIGGEKSIYTKLYKYPYEFEINSYLQLASIDGVKIATGSSNTITLTEEELNEKINTAVQLALETQDITSYMHLNEEYVSARGTTKMTKSGNTIVLTAYLNILKNIPSETTLITIDEQYKPKTSSVRSSALNAGKEVRYLNVKQDGTIWIYKDIDASASTTLEINLVWQI